MSPLPRLLRFCEWFMDDMLGKCLESERMRVFLPVLEFQRSAVLGHFVAAMNSLLRGMIL